MPDRRRYHAGQMRRFFKALREGATLASAAATAGCSYSGIQNRLKHDRKFRHAVNVSTGGPRMKVENAAFKAATTPDKNGRYDAKAIAFWLTNMAGDAWRLKPDEAPAEPLLDGDIRARANELKEDERGELREKAHEEILGGSTTVH